MTTYNPYRPLTLGNGSIEETNTTGLLCYLLDEQENHGLGDGFLRGFLKMAGQGFYDALYTKEGARTYAGVAVQPEVAFLSKDFNRKKDVIDVVVEFSSASGELTAVLGVEVKIHSGSESRKSGEARQPLDQLKKMVQRYCSQSPEGLPIARAPMISHIYLVPEKLAATTSALGLSQAYIDTMDNESVFASIAIWHGQKFDSIDNILRELEGVTAEANLLLQIGDLIRNDFFFDASAKRRLAQADGKLKKLTDQFPGVDWMPRRSANRVSYRLRGSNNPPLKLYRPGTKLSLRTIGECSSKQCADLNLDIERLLGKNVARFTTVSNDTLMLTAQDVTLGSLIENQAFRTILIELLQRSINSCQDDKGERGFRSLLAERGCHLKRCFDMLNNRLMDTEGLDVHYIRANQARITSDIRGVNICLLDVQRNRLKVSIKKDLGSYTDAERECLSPEINADQHVPSRFYLNLSGDMNQMNWQQIETQIELTVNLLASIAEGD